MVNLRKIMDFILAKIQKLNLVNEGWELHIIVSLQWGKMFRWDQNDKNPLFLNFFLISLITLCQIYL